MKDYDNQHLGGKQGGKVCKRTKKEKGSGFLDAGKEVGDPVAE